MLVLGDIRYGGLQISYYRTALTFAEEMGRKALQAQAHIALGNAQDGEDKGITHCRTALGFAEEIEDKSLQAQAHIALGNAQDGEDKGITHCRTALTLAEEIEDKALQAQSHIALGKAGDGQDKGISHFREAEKLAESIKDKFLQAHALLARGKSAPRASEAIPYYWEALILTEESGDKPLQTQVLEALERTRDESSLKPKHLEKKVREAQRMIDEGDASQKVKNKAQSYRKALILAIESENKILQAQAWIGLGNTEDGGDSIARYRMALTLAEELGDLSLQAQAYVGLGKSYYGNDRKMEGLVYYHKVSQLMRSNPIAEMKIKDYKQFIQHIPAALHRDLTREESEAVEWLQTV